MATTGWLRCDSVREGMFTDELAVVVSRSNGAEESYFVPASAVERSGNRLRVDLRESGSLFWATLPTSEPTTIPVSKARVEVK
jgi:hypothetical protein